MPTAHISAENGKIAGTVFMPGDPLRAKKIAETYLERPELINQVRGMLGYTGTFEGKPVTVMGSGMGMPSIGIYSHELFALYGVENIIRLGSCGSYQSGLDLYEVVLVTSAWTESSYAHTMSGSEEKLAYPSDELCDRLSRSAQKLGLPLRTGRIHTSDVFYRQPPWQGGDAPYWQRLRDEQGCMAVEMEAFALFHNAKALGKNAACLLTVSDSLVTGKETTAEERENSFTGMMRIALGIL